MGVPLWGWVLASCTGPETEVSSVGPATPGDPVIGWVSEVANDPESFAALTRDPGARAGWIAFHQHDYAGAITAFSAPGSPPVARGRAELALAVLYRDLASLSGLVNEQLFVSWAARGGLPPGGDAPLVAALAASCSGSGKAADWASEVGAGPDQAIARALGRGEDPFAVTSTGPFGRRMAIHREVLASGNPATLMAAATEPIVSVQEADFVRTFWDPCVYRTLSEVWLVRALDDIGTEGAGGPDQWRSLGRLVASDAGLDTRLFAAWPSTADLVSSLETAEEPGILGARSPSLQRLGLGAQDSTTDDAEGAKDEVGILELALEAFGKPLADGTESEGRTVIRDLGLVHRFRQEWLVVRAREALRAHQPRRASVFLDLGRDVGARTLGPQNGPALFALTAQARLGLGHTREALDALHVLVAGHAEAIGLVETTGDLAVLQGIDRQGDSKEE